MGRIEQIYLLFPLPLQLRAYLKTQFEECGVYAPHSSNWVFGVAGWRDALNLLLIV